MPQYPWTLAGATPPITEGAKGMGTGDKEKEDHLLEEMYPC